MFNVAGKVVVITGGTGGIGHAIAARLAAAGASVWILGRRAEGYSAADEIGANFLVCDVTDENAVDALFASIVQAQGRIDVLVQSAGAELDPVPLVERDVDDMDYTYRVNVMGAFLCIKHAAAHMPPGSSIINIGSIAGLLAIPGYTEHVVSKFALNGLGRSAAIELGTSGIRVNTICPSIVRTPTLDTYDGADAAVALCQGTSALGSVLDPSDVAALVHFLASDDSTKISGQEIVVDAGITAGFGVGVYNTIMRSSGLPAYDET